MRLGKASVYAIFATAHIAKNQTDDPVQGRVIAESYGISIEYLQKILQQLVRAQVIQSERGRRGGFRLRKLAIDTTLLEIVEAIEGPIDPTLSAQQEINGAEGPKDIIQNVWSEITLFTQSLLRQTTIRQLIDSTSTGHGDGPAI